jgi:CubicO group peptidase (beta-lactamase class C family)
MISRRTVCRVASLALLGLLPEGPLAAGPAEEPLPARARRVAEIVRTMRADNGLSAVLCGVWIGDVPAVIIADGNSMTEVPATPDMHYRIGGITEIFEAVLLMRYVDQQRCMLDDRLSRWLPDLRQSNVVTLRMLANSTSGYPDYVTSKSFVDAYLKNPFREWTARELIDIALSTPNQFAPGTSQAYSHTNLVILGEALQKIGGGSMRTLLRREITGPPGLRETDYPPTPEIAFPVLHAFASDRGPLEDSTYWNPAWTSHSGRMTSTLRDLGVFARAVGAGTLLSRKSRAELTAPTTVGLGNNRPNLYFALCMGVANGWMVQNPSFNGYSGIFGHLPSRRISIILATTLGPRSSPDHHYSTLLFKQLVKYLTPDTPIPDEFK